MPGIHMQPRRGKQPIPLTGLQDEILRQSAERHERGNRRLQQFRPRTDAIDDLGREHRG
jgi:hypothetical protein